MNYDCLSLGGINQMYSLGIDIGSVATKAVLFNGKMIDQTILPTGWSPKQTGKKIMTKLLQRNNDCQVDMIVVTGYGRIAIDFADKVVTEITCHGKGAYLLDHQVRTIIDIGGQDSKAININQQGKVIDFIMNDKCAAGTGKFLEVTMNSLGEDINEIDQLTIAADSEKINSMCTVFAESEVVSLLAQGADKAGIVKGIIESIAARTASLLNKITINDKILFTGGLANSSQITIELSKVLQREILTDTNSQLAGALGAAVIGWEELQLS